MNLQLISQTSMTRMTLRWLTWLLLVLALLLPGGGAQAAGSVTDCSTYGPGSGTLQAALTGGGSVTFACSGTIIVPEITISTDTVIDATGQTVTLSGNNANRVLTIASGVTVELIGLTISDGYSPNDDGGGIFNNGLLTITDSTIQNNSATYIGGGIMNSGTLTVNNSTISGNSASAGGGIYNDLGGHLIIDGSTLSNNSASDGAGIYMNGKTTITNSVIESNTATNWGGGIRVNSNLLNISNSTIRNNSAKLGGGIKVQAAGANLSGVTLNGNSAQKDGGGLYNGGAVTATNSTVSNNSASDYGGGIFVDSTTGFEKLTLNHVTVTNNTKGGILSLYSAPKLTHSIVANQKSGKDCDGPPSSAPISNGYNLDSDGSCNLTQATDIPNGAANLDSLADNGGPTQTHALLAGSDALDAIPPASCSLTTDQRGVTRPQGTNCDIGAFENSVPIAEAGGPYVVAEGGSVQLDGSGSSDAEQDATSLSYAWDFNGDGSYDDATGSSPTFSAASLDGPDSVTVGLQVTDDGGSTGTDTATITINNAAPTISSVANDGPIDAGNNATITVTASDPAGANDPLSYEFDCDNDSTYEVGPQAGNSATCFFGTDGSFTINVRVSDGDGGQATDSTTVTVEPVDNTPPVITPNVSGTLGNNGWYMSAVTVSFSCADEAGGSGLATNTVAGMTLTGDGADQSVTNTGECIDNAGNVALPVTVSGIDIDQTAPTASANVSPAANANGWNNSDVTVSFSGSDDTSGIASCDADIILSSDGAGQSASGICTDNAGNVSTLATASGINIDKTPPSVSITGVTDGATYILGSVPAAGCETTDALSGVATAASLSLSGGNPDGSGTITATCDGALDYAGNSGATSVTYTVITPQQAITNLENDIQSLVDEGVLKTGQANGLTHPLDNAIRSLNKGHTDDACNQLADFIDEVNLKTPTPLDEATAAELIASAEAIQTAIGCP